MSLCLLFENYVEEGIKERQCWMRPLFQQRTKNLEGIYYEINYHTSGPHRRLNVDTKSRHTPLCVRCNSDRKCRPSATSGCRALQLLLWPFLNSCRGACGCRVWPVCGDTNTVRGERRARQVARGCRAR
ncbi:hypothetical protein SFRURICE_021111 [Spodoptera frugiperda]|nr:hypothetical protein SFRURICE_021111 [Spodoptera frugiperda]